MCNHPTPNDFDTATAQGATKTEYRAPDDRLHQAIQAFSGVVDLLSDMHGAEYGFELTTPESLYALLSFIHENLDSAAMEIVRGHPTSDVLQP